MAITYSTGTIGIFSLFLNSKKLKLSIDNIEELEMQLCSLRLNGHLTFIPTDFWSHPFWFWTLDSSG